MTLAAQPDTLSADVPDGFVPLPIRDGYMQDFGQLYFNRDRRVIGMRITERHLNPHGIAHGGMLATLADTAIGMKMSATKGTPSVTANLSLDYLDAARPGNWVEAHVELDKMGSRLRFGSCKLICDGRVLLRATAIFAAVTPRE